MNALKLIKENFRSFLICVLSAICILVSYNIVRSASPALFFKYYSKDVIPWAMASMALFLIPTLYLYNKILSFFGPKKTFIITTLGFSFIIAGHFFLIKLEIAAASFTLFIIKDIYVMIMIEQVWSLFNSINDLKSAKILSGPLMACSSIGPIISGKVLSTHISQLGSLNVVILSASILIIAALIFPFIQTKNIFKTQKEKIEKSYGIKEILKNKSLLSLFFIVICSQTLATTTTLRLQAIVSDTINSMDAQTSYFANFYSNINSLALLGQLVITPLILNFIPLYIVHLSIPLLHIIIGIYVLMSSDLQTIMLASLAFKSIDYSIFRGVKELIYVPLSQDVRYRSKQIIDVFAYRSSKASVSTFLGLLKSSFKVPDITYSVFALVAAIIWQAFSLKLSKKIK